MSLRELVDDLVLHKNVKVSTDGGSTWASENALLVQLAEAITSSVNSGSGAGGAPNTRNLMDTDALHLLGMITTQVREWCLMVGASITKDKDAVVDLCSWYDKYSTTAGDGLDAAYERVLAGWVTQIKGMLNPPKIVEITAPCPECLEDIYINAEGNPIPHPIALHYWANSGSVWDGAHATCRACGHDWAGEWQLRGLRHAIE